MGDCADTAETAEEETPTEPDPCIDPAARSKRERKSKDEDAEGKKGKNVEEGKGKQT